MKKLLTGNITASAKMPIRKMTLDHLQEAYNEQIRALAIANGTDDYPGTPGTTARDILFGLQSTTVGSAFTANRGAIYTNGEIFLVPAASFTIGAGEYPVLVTTTAYATGDPTEFTDGNTYQIHQIRTATIVSGTTSTANYIGTFSDFSNKNLPNEVSTGAGITNGPNISTSAIEAKKDRLGVVVLTGSATMNSGFTSASVICTLPATHRPHADQYLPVVSIKGSTVNSIFIKITASTGVVQCIADPNAQIANNTVIYLDGTVFYIS